MCVCVCLCLSVGLSFCMPKCVCVGKYMYTVRLRVYESICAHVLACQCIREYAEQYARLSPSSCQCWAASVVCSHKIGIKCAGLDEKCMMCMELCVS